MATPPRTDAAKAEGAFRTIGEVAALLGLPQHILRYWETRFPQLKPLQRAGNRRYYRPADVALAQRIDRLLNREGYTVKGVQKLLEEDGAGETPAAPPSAAPPPATPQTAAGTAGPSVEALREVRATLAGALVEDAAE